MKTYSLSHLSDADLLRGLTALVVQDRQTTAVVLAHIAEVDSRRLYLPAGYPSMHAYCVGELHLSDGAAYRRIHAARAARQCPAVFTAVAEGRLHLTAVNLIAPRLATGKASDLIEMATHRRKDEIERGLAERFPSTEALPIVEVIPTVGSAFDLSPSREEGVSADGERKHAKGPSDGLPQLAPARVEDASGDMNARVPTEARLSQLAAAPQLAPARVQLSQAKVVATASGRFLLSVTVSQSVHDNLRYAQELLSYQIPSGDVAQVLDRALAALVRELEKQKFSMTDRPRRVVPSSSSHSRHIPAHVKRAVQKRDGGQCTFVSASGYRCASRTCLEFDHADPFALGGKATVENIRLRCRAHNQYTAERVFGSASMSDRRKGRARAAGGTRT